MMIRSPAAATTTNTTTNNNLNLTHIPDEIQVHILTFLRSFDLGPVQQTCQFYNNPERIHEVVTQFVKYVYGTEYTDGIIRMIDTSSSGGSNNNNNNNRKTSGSKNHHTKKNRSRNHQQRHQKSKPDEDDTKQIVAKTKPFRYTLGHLRSIELAVVARVLSLPEPKTGYFVSKAWIKKTLLWLDKADEQSSVVSVVTPEKKKLTKKQQRQRNRRLSDVSPPWPNANSDILCEHQNLLSQSGKAARSHRKLMDKKSWKVLSKLYPDSTQLSSVAGECLQCRMEAETARRAHQDWLEQQKLERKRPLSNPHVRRFYTRTRGVPYHCLVENINNNNEEGNYNKNIQNNFGDDGGGKMSTPKRDSQLVSRREITTCPLSSGTYVMLPRAWCHQWRRYIKTGGSMPLPPDSSALLCDAHKLSLLPPHLEAFLRGETSQLYASVKDGTRVVDGISSSPSPVAMAVASRSPVMGVQPVLDVDTINALVAAGISRTEAVTAQRMAMMRLEQQQQRIHTLEGLNGNNEDDTHQTTTNRESLNELLDRENYVVTELVTHEEWLALQEMGSWRKQASLAYSMCVTVDNDGSFDFSTLPCRECDPTGLRFESYSCVKANNHNNTAGKNSSSKSNYSNGKNNRWRK